VRRLAYASLHFGAYGCVLAFSKFHALVYGYDLTSSFRFPWVIAYCAVLSVTMYALGLPDGPRTARGRIAAAFGTAVLAALAISFAQLLLGSAVLPRYVVFSTSMLIVPWVLVSAHFSAHGRARLEERDRVVVVSDQPIAVELQGELHGRPERPASIVATLGIREVVGSRAEPDALRQRVASCRATVVVLGPDAQSDDRIIEQAAYLHESGVRIRTTSLFYEEWLGKIPVGDLARVSLFFDIGEVHRAMYGRFKRILDVGFGAVGVVLTALVLPAVLVGNHFRNQGPLFYVQERIGRSGRPFRIYKFRTMVPLASAASSWTTNEDPRVTDFGRLLRRTHLDELPQALNILRGDLSMVGPRPEQPAYVEELTTKLPFYGLRHCVRPGLTGWAQVKYGYAGDEADAREKLQYDFHYLRRQSVGFDLRIVARTIRSVIVGDGR
jgi:lipopolysaccharide/colanic/teichoic acid biosynthesis glycosyltransferase